MGNNNNPLGKFELSGIPTVPQIGVSFSIDANAVKIVSALDKGT